MEGDGMIAFLTWRSSLPLDLDIPTTKTQTTQQMPFVTALRVTRHLLRQKIMLSQRDYVGVILFGAEKESEATEEGEGEGGFTAFSLDSFGSQVNINPTIFIYCMG